LILNWITMVCLNHFFIRRNFMVQPFEIIRSKFPSLSTNRVFFDGPGGTQVPQRVIDRMQDYLVNMNANHGGAFRTSQDSDKLVERARKALADFYNAARPEEIVFGANMTTLTLSMSRSIAQELNPGDEIIVTHLDHDANISPWLHIAKQKGCVVRWLDFNPVDCTLRMDQLDLLINERTKLIAAGYASNAVGTINPIQRVVEKAQKVGALTYIDAVHYAPHGPIDVQSLGCDFLVTSAYKFFGPHVGILYGKHEHLERLNAFKVRPAPENPPGKFETGTGNFEGIAGVLGAVEHLSEVGTVLVEQENQARLENQVTQPLSTRESMKAIREHEKTLTLALLQSLQTIPGLRIWGIKDDERIYERVPTFSFTMDHLTPRQISKKLAAEGIHVWDGNYYALAVTERLELEDKGGMVRVGLVHYNTFEEIDQLHSALLKLG
jgi:cysteine desulfurase family protein (TIGR01976 family)